MKTPEDLLRFIDNRYSRMLVQPEGYAESPNGLQSMISLLEEIREFVLDQPGESGKFNSFLISQGYPVTGICTEPGESVTLTDDLLRKLRTVAGVMRQFLETEGRLPH